MVKILHVIFTEKFGGIEAFQKNLYENIDKTEYRMSFVTTSQNTKNQTFVKDFSEFIHVLPPRKNILAYSIQLYKLIKKEKYNIVHIHKNSCSNPSEVIVSKLAGVNKIILHAHNTGAVVSGVVNIFHYMFRPLMRALCDVRLACSNKAGAWLFGGKTDFELVRNGIKIEKYLYDEEKRKAIRQKLGIKDDQIVIGHVGNFLLQKNHPFMIEIMRELKNVSLHYIMMFVGGGKDMEDAKQYAKKLSVSDKIMFMGSRSDACDLYQAMDLFLFPSFHEGLPIAGVEAQTSGLACLFSSAITSEVIITDNVEVLSLDEPIDKWVSKIVEKANNFIRCKQYDEIYESGYSIEKTALQIERIYAG